MSNRLYNIDQTPAAREMALVLVLLRDVGTDELVAAAQYLDVDNDSLADVAEHFRDHHRDILGFLRSRVRMPEQAEDLLQQVFLKVMQRSDWSEIRNPEAYLRTTARHVLADFYRSQNARDQGIVLEYQEFRHADETWSPGDSLRSGEFFDRLAGVLDSLSPNVRKAFVLSRVYGYTYAEIGQALSISPRTVEKHVAKGLAWCFERFSDTDDDRNRVNGPVE